MKPRTFVPTLSLAPPLAARAAEPTSAAPESCEEADGENVALICEPAPSDAASTSGALTGSCWDAPHSVLVFAVSLGIVGCAAGPSQEQLVLAAADVEALADLGIEAEVANDAILLRGLDGSPRGRAVLRAADDVTVRLDLHEASLRGAAGDLVVTCDGADVSSTTDDPAAFELLAPCELAIEVARILATSLERDSELMSAMAGPKADGSGRYCWTRSTWVFGTDRCTACLNRADELMDIVALTEGHSDSESCTENYLTTSCTLTRCQRSE